VSHFEIVHGDGDQPFHTRLVASNGRIVLHSETYTERAGAATAIAVAAEAFGITMSRPPEEQADPEAGELGFYGEAPDGNVYVYGVRDVDEREATR
jgi:uncharacterized protein YegP (UPF0339 family)